MSYFKEIIDQGLTL